MSVGFYITFIGLLTRRYIEQTPKNLALLPLERKILPRLPAFWTFQITPPVKGIVQRKPWRLENGANQFICCATAALG
jgi:hypothetical protein